jgi:hypothetical protein
MSTESVQLELPLEFEEIPLPPDAAPTVRNYNTFFKAVKLYPSHFGRDLYETALAWDDLTNGEKNAKIRDAIKLHKEDADV